MRWKRLYQEGRLSNRTSKVANLGGNGKDMKMTSIIVWQDASAATPMSYRWIMVRITDGSVLVASRICKGERFLFVSPDSLIIEGITHWAEIPTTGFPDDPQDPEDSSEPKLMRYFIDGEVIDRKQTPESKTCKHDIVVRKFDGHTYRFCALCDLLAHQDGSFAYPCYAEWCKCMQ
jgi:hypothetical protein